MLYKVHKVQHKPLTFSSLQIPKSERAGLRTSYHTLFRTVELDTLHRAGVARQTLQNRQNTSLYSLYILSHYIVLISHKHITEGYTIMQFGLLTAQILTLQSSLPVASRRPDDFPNTSEDTLLE